VPSSSIVKEPRLLPDLAGEGRGLFAVEIAFEPVPDRLVQHDPGPARPEYDRHLARRGGHRAEIDQRLAQRLVDLRSPMGRVEVIFVADAPAGTVRARLHPVAFADDDRNVEAHQRADVGGAAAIRPDDLHRLPDARE
jgi:hypothetical protein